MQNKINLSIMMPKDGSSNIPMHVDTHSGESPFQCVLWIPLVNIFGSKGMYILPPEKNRELMKNYSKLILEGGQNSVKELVEKDLIWPEIKFGQFFLFSPNFLHGSVTNETNETRWSLNTRFKSLFSPYTSNEKGLGNFYSPIKVSPTTKLGIDYESPSGLIENE